MNQELLKQATWALERAIKAGATEASSWCGRSRAVKVNYRDRKPEKVQESTSSSLSLTVYVEGRYSSHSTSDLRPDALEQFVDMAVASTRPLTIDPHRKLPDPRWYAGQRDVDLGLYDPAYGEVTQQSRHELSRAVENVALSQSEAVISVTAGTSDSIGESVLVHSNGFEGYRRSTSFWAGANVTVQGEGDRRPAGSDWRGGPLRSLLPAAEEVGKTACLRALKQVGARRIETQTMPMIVQNRTVRTLLGGLLSAMSGSNLQQKQSFLDGKKGQKVGSATMTMWDDPFVPSGLGSRLYDGEGLTANELPLFDGGMLRNYFLDSYYARKLSMEPTTGSASNLVFPAGTRSVESLMTEVGKGIVVTGFLGGNSNSTTGDFSHGILGSYFENGEAVHPVSSMNIAGNHLEFWNNLIEMADDPYPYSGYRTPSLLFDKVQFSGS